MIKLVLGISFCTQLIFATTSWAQILVEDGGDTNASEASPASPRVGRAAATDYFKKREKVIQRRTSSSSDRVLMLHLGKFINDKAYRWGTKSSEEGVGNTMFGVTYRMGEWKGSMDLYIRAEMMSYTIDEKSPLKLSFMPIIAFPDARSEFPLYFGAGAGAGILFKQLCNERDVAVQYALIVGARFGDLFESGGLFIESGMKGHIHLLSSGQHDGVYLAAGGMFNF